MAIMTHRAAFALDQAEAGSGLPRRCSSRSRALPQRMICLDINYLILRLVAESSESAELRAWAAAGETLVTPMVAWYEFLCGPVTDVPRDTMRAFLQTRLPFDEPQAQTAAELFNRCGRRRALRVDAMIAAAAISAGARLATNNREDFALFVESGLQLQTPA